MSNFELSPPQIHVNQAEVSSLESQKGNFAVQFWGVRGLIATPSHDTRRYGGNTACVEMLVAGKRLIFDGGTGLRILGKSLRNHQQLQAHLFFTNSQSNRILGFPFFAPAFIPENHLYIYGTAASNSASIKQCLCDQMLQPYFPYPLQLMQAELQFHNLNFGQVVNIDDVSISTALINQSQKSIGYRVTWQDYSVAYLTDLSKIVEESDRQPIIELSQGVDLLIANATYTELTPRKYQNGDFYWQTALDLANASGVKKLVISQHHPDDDDDFLDGVEAKIKSMFAEAELAREGLIVSIDQ
ncbi:MBL fold metallo-hydrolase [Calothrix sp. UHCC 0171]|uniref:MBL fold metallo-hydrolase n=1 Tax=Calothrix sp. UHCC 0171 TaxID=3110245 RepID=UPI002B1F1671|nr:MBL fold metallo-hydrolase [Calothrix sp. UHCC 0171]MEA5570561.1 MBL fold metallo-hydrolase [Calothrix sp. UHCC 0171]